MPTPRARTGVIRIGWSGGSADFMVNQAATSAPVFNVSFSLFDPGRMTTPTTECQIKSATSVPTTCTLVATANLPTAIVTYDWLVQYPVWLPANPAPGRLECDVLVPGIVRSIHGLGRWDAGSAVGAAHGDRRGRQHGDRAIECRESAASHDTILHLRSLGAPTQVSEISKMRSRSHDGRRSIK